MLVTGFNPGTTLATVVVLILMHVVAWATGVELLTRLTRVHPWRIWYDCNR